MNRPTLSRISASLLVNLQRVDLFAVQSATAVTRRR
jgi:hypothetical protein